MPQPAIVIIEDSPGAQYFMMEEAKAALKGKSIDLVAFVDNESAKGFIDVNAHRVIGYVTDLMHYSSESSERPTVDAGLAFLDDIVRKATPQARVLICSRSAALVMRQLRARLNDDVRLADAPMSSEAFRHELLWIAERQASVDGESLEGDVGIIEAVAVPWDSVCREIAAHPEWLHKMPPHDFEALVAALFREAGWDTELTAQTRDGGFDIIAVRKIFPTTVRALIEVKRYPPDRPVGVGVVRALYGLRGVESSSQLILATSSHVSRDAKQQYRRVIPHELNFVERDLLLDWCRTYGKVRLRGTLA
jgi:hypothetical protein